MEVTALIAASILFAVGLLHVYWAFGGRRGGGAVIPQHEGKQAFLPGPGPTLVVAVAVTAAGVALLAEAEIVNWPVSPGLIRTVAWMCAAVFALRAVGEFDYFGMFKKRRQTVFARMDTYLYTPLCAFLSLTFVWSIL